ncbi:competence protein CoiA [Pilibacter termitis]|uniref:Competence protein CoiA n=1 Tax=Pilibacter termitis TaxID=263852 RepID=A0A1T4NQP3_9ENTE|nr:competence protein CoiA family protein [Pilibacter termitis]SJZ81088.1 competence protein CoiA [Pilibacter termitis]
MLIAKNKKEEYLNVCDFTREELLEKREEFWLCPSCLSPVRLKVGKVKTAHFAHLAKHDCAAFSEPESEEHLNLKRVFYQWGKNAQLEMYLPELQQRPDCLLHERICLEIQCSRLSLDRLIERTENYLAKHYQVFWLLDEKFPLKNNLSPLLRAFLSYSNRLGFYLWRVSLKEQKLYLHYHLVELQNGELHYQTAEYPFFKGNLEEILSLSAFETHEFCYQMDQHELASKLHQKRYKELNNKNKESLTLQTFLYMQGLHILKLPKYYYFPLTTPLACKEEVIKWKFFLYQKLAQGATLKECLEYLLLQELECYDLPQVKKTDILTDFIVEEIHSLRALNCLVEKKNSYQLQKHKTTQVIPYDYQWQNFPLYKSNIPRNL